MGEYLPNFRHLRTFCEAERLRSISRAADAVFLSQPAATQAIAKLEDSLGTPLLERAGNGVSPTVAGQAYVTRARRAISMIEEGIAETIRIGSTKSGRQARDILPLLTTTQLRALVAVGTTNNFTLAARLIGTSQPAIHRSTRELEAILNVALFEKTTRGILLTRAGQILWQQLKLAFSELRQGLMDVSSCQGFAKGNIVIGCMPLARHFVMPETLVSFSTRFSEVTIRIIDSPYPDLLHGLRHGEIDFLVGALRTPAPVDDVLQEPLFSASLCIAARNDHPLANRKSILLDELLAYPWILPPPGTPTREHFERLASGTPHPSLRLIESSSQILIRGLLMDSDHLTLISRQQVRFEVELGQLTTLDYDLGDSLREIGLTTRVNWHPSEIQRAFIQTLRAVAARHSEI
ncbi:LysR family transcriptional regulator [Zoogloea sp.]|uniref:LysR family transcriptional regulator n=1 Tax=Zoogloea sp. TaxID=49181 RepID=UPI001AD2204F|nr:LysR family transcriptional regulator [Zoogloea sp.]MBN8283248.1 LysR family transcriptional regulator [Zoogloea sp.]